MNGRQSADIRRRLATAALALFRTYFDIMWGRVFLSTLPLVIFSSTSLVLLPFFFLPHKGAGDCSELSQPGKNTCALLYKRQKVCSF